MREIKSIFKKVEASSHCGSHRTSDGFVYQCHYGINVVGPFLSEMIYLSYQDLKIIQDFINECRKKYSSDWMDYDDALSYDSDYYIENFEDFGFCDFFNNRFSSKYGIILAIGDISECKYLFEEEKSILSLVNENVEKAEKQIIERINNIQNNIILLKNKINLFMDEIGRLKSEESHKHFLCCQLYPIIVERTTDFNLNETIVCGLYPLDVALDFRDETLIDKLISLGAYRYSGQFVPQLSAKVGDYSHIKELFKHEERVNEDIKMFFEFLKELPSDEFNTFIFEKDSDVKRNGRILLASGEKKPILLRLYSRSQYNKIFDRNVISLLCQYFQKKNFKMANKIIWFCKENFIHLDERDVLRSSFEYGNISYLNTFFMDDLVDEINEYGRFDDGRNFRISCYFQDVVTVKNIGEDFFNDIKNYILKHYNYHPENYYYPDGL